MTEILFSTTDIKNELYFVFDCYKTNSWYNYVRKKFMGNYRKSLQLTILKDKLYILKAFERKNALKLYIF